MTNRESDLDGKSAIVTGGARGVAKGVAAAMLKVGARVLIVDREEDLGRETQRELSAHGEVIFEQFDLTRHAELPRLVDKAVALFSGLDILINAAQAAQMTSIAETSDQGMRLPFDTGYWPTFILMRAAYPHLVASKGTVINFATGAAFDAIPGHGSYAAAKEAIRAISKIAASEWGPLGIRVNIVCPFANSPGVEAYVAQFPDEFAAQIDKVSLRRVGDCEQDIGAAVVFLASDAARYITGQTLMVDGGQTKAF